MVNIPEGFTFEEEEFNGENLIIIVYDSKLYEPVWDGERFKGYRRKR